MRFLYIFLFSFLFLPKAFAEDSFLSSPTLFSRTDLSLQGRLRHLTLKNLSGGPGVGGLNDELVILEREGQYPNWKSFLSVYSYEKGVEARQVARIELASDAIFYSFVPMAEKGSALVLVKPTRLELYLPTEKGWELAPELGLKISGLFPVPEEGEVNILEVQGSEVWVPLQTGVGAYSVSAQGIKFERMLSILPRGYYNSSVNRLPLDTPFWLRASLWFPQASKGHLGNTDALFWTWSDEVTILPHDTKKPSTTLSFHQLNEAEREDGTSWVVTTPDDLNGDGQTDFVVNKFTGQATSLRAQTTLFFASPNGIVPEKGAKLIPEGNRTAGAVVVDVNNDKKKDLVVASSQFNAWAIVRAILQRRVNVNFSFYLHRTEGGYTLTRPDFHREISFKFDLSRAEIEGLLPTLEGDFNGDGYPDALYARDREEISVLFQKPGSDEIFPAHSTRTYAISVPSKYRIGDVNGDGKSDLVLYDFRSGANQKVLVLFAQSLR